MNKLENTILTTRLESLKEQLEASGVIEARGLTNESDARKLSFCFVVYSLQRFLDNSVIDEIIESITDGGNDNCIDAFDIDVNDNEINVNLFQMKYKSENKLQGTFGENEVILFLEKIKKLIILDEIAKTNMNPQLQVKYNEFKDITKTANKKDIKIKLFLITNGSDIKNKEKSLLDDFKKEYSTVTHFEIKNDYSFFVEKQYEKTKEVEIPIHFDHIPMNGDITASIVNLKAYDLAKLYKEYEDRILEQNIRKLLNSEINKNIKKVY